MVTVLVVDYCLIVDVLCDSVILFCYCVNDID